MKQCSFILLVLLFLFPFQVHGEIIIKKGQVLSIQECIDIARKRHPSIIASMNSVAVNESLVGEARSNYFPQISGTAGYNRVSVQNPYSKSSGSGNSLDNSVNQYSAGVALNQTIFDFWKTPSQVKIRKFGVDSSRADYEYAVSQIVYNVKVAYFNLLQAFKKRDVFAEIVEQNQQHLNQAKGYFEVKMKPKYDVMAAEVNLSNAKFNLIKAENVIRTAKVSLNNALGVVENPDYSIADILTYAKIPGASLENFLLIAFRNRQDFRSLQVKTKAAEQSITLAQTGFFPVLSGSATYNWSGSNYPLANEWQAGVAVSLPIFSGLLTVNQIREARATLNVIKSNEEILKQQIILDVQQAFIGINEAEESIPTAELAVIQAKENLDIANGRYQAGVGSPLEVSDAQVLYINAKQSHIEALVNFNIARASLEKAIGAKI